MRNKVVFVRGALAQWTLADSLLTVSSSLPPRASSCCAPAATPRTGAGTAAVGFGTLVPCVPGARSVGVSGLYSTSKAWHAVPVPLCPFHTAARRRHSHMTLFAWRSASACAHPAGGPPRVPCSGWGTWCGGESTGCACGASGGERASRCHTCWGTPPVSSAAPPRVNNVRPATCCVQRPTMR